MLYFETNAPYYAIIGAKNKEKAVKVYNEMVSDCDEEDASRMKEIERDIALVKFARAKGESGELLPVDKLLAEFKDGGLLIIDRSLF